MATRPAPLHTIIEQTVREKDRGKLSSPGTIVWAKLRGYPWWPGVVKSFDDVPRELATIAMTQYKQGAMIAVYFFGSHDFSLVPFDDLRPFEENWEIFHIRSGNSRFKLALTEARNPYNIAASNYTSPALTGTSTFTSISSFSKSDSSLNIASPSLENGPTTIKRKRGRPPKKAEHIAPEARSSPANRSEKMQRIDVDGFATLAFVDYCRHKLQKILLRPKLKDLELPVALKILQTLSQMKISVESIRRSKIGRVLRISMKRPQFAVSSAGATQSQFSSLSDRKYHLVAEAIQRLLGSWCGLLHAFIAEVGIF